MEEHIARFKEQFDWQPTVENAEKLPTHPRDIIVAGMGGSHLGAELILRSDPTLPFIIHRDYGLPSLSPERLKESLVIASSYSGNTEETLDAANAAFAAGIPVAVITVGGALLEFARDHTLPYVQMPDTGLQPRLALGYSMLGIAALLRDNALVESIQAAGHALNLSALDTASTSLTEKLTGTIPFIYSSERNSALGYVWKIALNENAKIPASHNVFPELCHNELCGYDIADTTRELSSRIMAVFLSDPQDHPRTVKRMRIMQSLLAARGIKNMEVPLDGKTTLDLIFRNVVLGMKVSSALARHYGIDAEPVPLVEEFKKLMDKEPES